MIAEKIAAGWVGKADLACSGLRAIEWPNQVFCNFPGFLASRRRRSGFRRKDIPIINRRLKVKDGKKTDFI